MKLTAANKILENKLFRSRLAELEKLEQDRKFCCHGLEHLMSVARITMLLCAEENIPAVPDVVYSAALLHDLGRIEEYTCGTPHETASLNTAEIILDETGCNEEIKCQILGLIASHRSSCHSKDRLAEVFCIADKKSRMCRFCSAVDECNWSDEKKNFEIEV